MHKAMSFLFVLLLCSCKTVETYHNKCTTNQLTISAQVSCLKSQINNDEHLKTNASSQRLLKTGDELVIKVRSGTLDEDEAQAELQEALKKMYRDEIKESAYKTKINHTDRSKFPRERHCNVGKNGNLHCSAY